MLVQNKACRGLGGSNIFNKVLTQSLPFQIMGTNVNEVRWGSHQYHIVIKWCHSSAHPIFSSLPMCPYVMHIMSLIRARERSRGLSTAAQNKGPVPCCQLRLLYPQLITCIRCVQTTRSWKIPAHLLNLHLQPLFQQRFVRLTKGWRDDLASCAHADMSYLSMLLTVWLCFIHRRTWLLLDWLWDPNVDNQQNLSG